MLKNKLIFLFCLFVTIVIAIGCGGGDSDFTLLDNPPFVEKPISYKIENGKLKPISGGIQGVEIITTDNTFEEGAVITIEENLFEGTRSSYLTNAPKTYRVYGVMESNNPLVPVYPIDTVDKPVSIQIPNTITGDAEAYYFGIRPSKNDDWKFIRINEDISSNDRLDINMVRAALPNSGSFTIKTNKLNQEFALFALIKGDEGKLPSTLVEAIKTVIEPANKEKSEEGKMPVKNDYYTDNMKITIDVGGKNVNSLKLFDYVLEITFVNNSFNVNKKLGGNSASYPTPKPTHGLASGQNWEHSVIINNIEGSADKLQFIVNTEGISTEYFPQNFSINIKNKNNIEDTLPFEYTESVQVEGFEPIDEPVKPKEDEPVEPIIEPIIEPVKPTVAFNKLNKNIFKLGEDVILSWSEVKEQSEKPVSYKLALDCDIAEQSKEVDVEGISWNCNTLPCGNYTAKVVVTIGDDTSIESEPISFQIKSAIPTAPLLNPLDVNTFKLGEPVFLAWAPSKDPFDKPITYDLYLYTSECPEVPTAKNLNATMWMSTKLATGTYNIKLVATNGTESNETVIPEAFTVWSSSRATICETPGSAYSSEVYSVRPEFWVEISEKNFDENEIINAIAIDGITSSDINKEWIDGKLKISFNNDLTKGQPCSIAMGTVKDKYDTEITPFTTKAFNVVSLEGKGTEEEPFIPITTDATYLTNDGKLALISPLNSEVGCFKDMVFGNATINIDGTEKWSSLSAANVNDSPFVEIPNTDLWPASKTNMEVTMTFDGTIEGKTYKFATTSKNYSTETGKIISVGDGSEDKPYLIYTPGQFDDLRNYYNTGSNFKQLRDINLEEYIASTYSSTNSFPRIGSYGSSGFNGIYDGCNHVVKKLRMVSDYGDLALFGGLATANTVVKNVGLEDVYICAKGPWVAAFAAESADGSLINCHATGEIRSERSLTSNQTSGTSGGLVGKMSKGSIISCHFTGTVFGSIEYSCNDVGGIVGRVDNWNREVVIKDCYVEDTTISGGSSTGGIIGNLGSGKSIENCYVKNTTINGNSYSIGGLVGNYSNCSADKCYVENCTIEGNSYIGGVVGNIGSSDYSKDSIKNSYFTGTVKGNSQLVGGFIGYNSGMSFENCHVEATRVEGSGDDVGGFAGYNYCNKCKKCWVNITTLINNSGSYTGGFIGNVSGGEYTDCYTIIESLETFNQYAGLFAGYNSGNISNCHAEGSLTGPANIGGFIGYNGNSIQKSYCKASVTGTSANIGGFAGYNGYTIKNCYCEGSVTNSTSSASNMGGFAGSDCGGSATITNSYSTCSVTEVGSVTNIGLLTGYMSSSSKFENCYTNVNPSAGIPLFGLTDGCSTANSQYLDGYDSSLGWDSEIWDLSKPLPTLL